MAGIYHRRGVLIPEACERCGELKVEKHHPDYTKPLKVEWLCRPCHLELHAKLKADQRAALNEILSRAISAIEDKINLAPGSPSP